MNRGKSLILLVEAGIVLVLAAQLFACRHERPPDSPVHAASGVPPPSDPIPPPQVRARPFDQVTALAEIERAVSQDGRTRVMIEFDTPAPLGTGSLTPGQKKERRQQMRQAQREVLESLGRTIGDKDVQLIEGLPFIGLDVTAVELGLLRRGLTPAGALELEAAGRRIGLRIEVARPLHPQSTAVIRGTPVEDVLKRIEVDGMTATGQGMLVVVIDSAPQPDALPLVDRLVDPPAIAGGGTGLPTPAALSSGATHGTKVASVVALAAPGCGIVPWSLRSDDGPIQPDKLADALSKIYFAEEPSFLPRVAAVCVSLANLYPIDGPCLADVPAAPVLTAFRLAVVNLTQSGVAVVVSAGTASGAYCREVSSPWCMPEAICAASSDGLDLRRSAYSPWSTLVDLAAPGGGIDVQIFAGGGRHGLSGTSIAAPFVAGLFARLAEAHPNSNLGQRLLALRKTGYDLSDCEIHVPEVRGASASGLLGP